MIPVKGMFLTKQLSLDATIAALIDLSAWCELRGCREPLGIAATASGGKWVLLARWPVRRGSPGIVAATVSYHDECGHQRGPVFRLEGAPVGEEEFLRTLRDYPAEDRDSLR